MIFHGWLAFDSCYYFIIMILTNIIHTTCTDQKSSTNLSFIVFLAHGQLCTVRLYDIILYYSKLNF